MSQNIAEKIREVEIKFFVDAFACPKERSDKEKWEIFFRELARALEEAEREIRADKIVEMVRKANTPEPAPAKIEVGDEVEFKMTGRVSEIFDDVAEIYDDFAKVTWSFKVKDLKLIRKAKESK